MKQYKKIILILISNLLLSNSFADDGGTSSSSALGLGGLAGMGNISAPTGGMGGAGGSGVSGGPSAPTIVALPSAVSSNPNLTAYVNASHQFNQQDLSTTQDQQTSDDSASASNMQGSKRSIANQNVDPFIRNVYVRTGLLLNKYGSDLIAAPNSFMPAQNIPVPANYSVGPGDFLSIQASGAVNDDYSSKVNSDGTIFIPKLGPVPVTGVKSDQLNRYLEQKLAKIYRNFSINSNVAKVRSIQVTVTGLAAQPGTYTLSSLSTLSNAIMAVGGPSPVGSFRDIVLKRNGITVAHFDLYDLLIRGNNYNDLPLLAGDVLEFKPVGNQVAIYNGVKRPGIYETKPGETTSDILYFAGGLTSEARSDKVVLETTNTDNNIEVKDYTWNEAKNLPIQKNEIIHFFIAQNKYVNSVAVIGNINDPSRFPYKPGMRVKDLIPNKEVLLTNSYYDSVAFNTYGQDNALTQLRVEKTTQYASIDSGISSSSGFNSSNTDKHALNNQSVFGGGQNMFKAGPVAIPEGDINWNYALIVRQDRDNFTSHIIPFNLKKAIAGDPANNLQLQPGDVINVLSAKDVRTSVASAPVYVFIDGEVNAPGVYELKAGQSLKDALARAGGVTPRSYIFGMEINRESVKKQQQQALDNMLDLAQQSLLAQASTSGIGATTAQQSQNTQMIIAQQNAFIQKMRNIKPNGRVILNLGSASTTVDNLPDFKLENGDTIYVPPLPDVVNVVGQVYNPGTFIYNKKYGVGDYINMAGDENQYADSSAEYVLRADGTLYSRKQAGWFGGFYNRNLNPGDVIIVPQQIMIGSGVQALLSWTQIIANSAQAVALFRK